MARILSSPWSIIRGSIAGTTYFANQYHQIVARARTSPATLPSGNQTKIKSAFAAALGTWQSLSEAVQDDWNLFAKTCTYQGATGSYNVPGQQIFQGARALQNYVLLQAWAAPTLVTGAPATTGFNLLGNVTPIPYVGPGTGVSVSFQTDPVDASMIVGSISPPLDKENLKYGGPWRVRDSQAAILPADAGSFMEFDNLLPGKIYFVRLIAVSDDIAPRISASYIVRDVAQTVAPIATATTKKKSR